MKKLLLNIEALNVESFQVGSEGNLMGTVQAAEGISPATMMLSQCASACMQSGIRPCLATETCC